MNLKMYPKNQDILDSQIVSNYETKAKLARNLFLKRATKGKNLFSWMSSKHFFIKVIQRPRSSSRNRYLIKKKYLSLSFPLDQPNTEHELQNTKISVCCDFLKERHSKYTKYAKINIWFYLKRFMSVYSNLFSFIEKYKKRHNNKGFSLWSITVIQNARSPSLIQKWSSFRYSTFFFFRQQFTTYILIIQC